MGVVADVVGVRAVLVGAGALVALALAALHGRGLLPAIDHQPAITRAAR
jgi:hypothetical protein